MKPYRYLLIAIIVIIPILFMTALYYSSKTTYSELDYINKDTEEVLDMRWNY